MKSIRFALLAALCSATGALAQTDGGTPTCDQVTNGATPIYLGGSSALQPFVKNIGPKLAAQANPYILFYSGPGSCVGVNNVIDPVANPLAAGTQFSFYTSNAGVITENKCVLPASQTKLDLGISDVFVETCTSAARPTTIGDYVGPAQAMLFVVPKDSTQTAITAEEAYIALGFGGKDQLAPPWVVDNPANFFFIRNNKSGTQLILSAAIGVPAAKWKGKDTGGSGAVYTALTMASGDGIEKSLGILGADYVDQKDTDGTPRRNKVKMLAFSGKGQKYAYYPDSTKNSYDKKNLREGRYLGLGYAHLVTPLKADGTPEQAKVAYLVDLITGKDVTPAPGFDVTTVISQNAFLIPQCAMKVKRTSEGGAILPFVPEKSCGCFYESLVGTASSSCVSCATSACSTGTVCRSGFCEAN